MLIVAAVIWYFAKWPLIIYGGIGAFTLLLISAVNWCSQRWPMTTHYVGWFILGMLRGMRRR